MSHLTVFTYHTKVSMTDAEIADIMDFIGTKLDKNLVVGGARRLSSMQEKDFWKHYNSKKEVKKKKIYTMLIKKRDLERPKDWVKLVPKSEEIIEYTQEPKHI